MLYELLVFWVLEALLDVEGQRQVSKHIFPNAMIVLSQVVEEGLLVAEEEVALEVVVDDGVRLVEPVPFMVLPPLLAVDVPDECNVLVVSLDPLCLRLIVVALLHTLPAYLGGAKLLLLPLFQEVSLEQFVVNLVPDFAVEGVFPVEVLSFVFGEFGGVFGEMVGLVDEGELYLLLLPVGGVQPVLVHHLLPLVYPLQLQLRPHKHALTRQFLVYYPPKPPLEEPSHHIAVVAPPEVGLGVVLGPLGGEVKAEVDVVGQQYLPDEVEIAFNPLLVD